MTGTAPRHGAARSQAGHRFAVVVQADELLAVTCSSHPVSVVTAKKADRRLASAR
jgi:hypothetical protein